MNASQSVSLVLISLLSAACAGVSRDTAACSAFGTALVLRDRVGQAAATFNAGEPIELELAVANLRREPSTLTAGSSCTAVLFEVTSSAQRRVWGSADGIGCIQMLQPRTYAPLETVLHSVVWDQRDSDGTVVQPGTFRVAGSVGQYASDAAGLVDCGADLGKSATFRIR